MKSAFEWLARTINRHPHIVAGVTAAVFVIALFGTTMLTMETGDDTYIDKTTPRGGAPQPLQGHLRLRRHHDHL